MLSISEMKSINTFRLFDFYLFGIGEGDLCRWMDEQYAPISFTMALAATETTWARSPGRFESSKTYQSWCEEQETLYTWTIDRDCSLSTTWIFLLVANDIRFTGFPVSHLATRCYEVLLDRRYTQLQTKYNYWSLEREDSMRYEQDSCH
jgi:hypothetical protein